MAWHNKGRKVIKNSLPSVGYETELRLLRVAQEEPKDGGSSMK